MRDYTVKTLLLCLLSLACGCSSTEKRDTQEVDEELMEAARCGRLQALRLSPAATLDSMEMERVIIDVRVREAALRRENEDALADRYIESFIATLDSVNPSLHAELVAAR